MALKRFVDGAEKEPFFQKRAPDNAPDWMRTVDADLPVGPDGRRGRRRRRRALAWVANLGCIDLNPHPVRADDLDHPDELRVDLDPVPGVPLVAGPRGRAASPRGARGRRASPAGRRRRARAGIHINVRIEPRWTYGEVRRAALALARDVERRAPSIATSQVVEGGAPRRVPRLQPERQGPHRRVRVLGAADARRAGLVPAALGRGAGRRSWRTSRSRPCPRSTRSAATPARGSTRRSARWRRCSSCPRATRRRARATRRGRRTTRSRRASRRACSRRRSAAGRRRSTRAAARTAGRRRRSPRSVRPRSPRATERRAADRVAGVDAVAHGPPQVERAGGRDRAGGDEGRGLRGA